MDILVAGAGPTGLATALQAHQHGASVRVVERRTDPVRRSRAMIMHGRTLEALRPLGVTDALLERGDVSPQAELHVGRRSIPLRLGQVDLPQTAFPRLMLIRQMDVEEVLTRALQTRGVAVERGTELLDLRSGDDADGVEVVLRADGRPEEGRCRFLAGCDGSDSTVRRLAGVDFVGGAHHEEVVLADVELDGLLDHGRLHVAVGARGLVFLFARGEGASWRLLATRPARRRPADFAHPSQRGPEDVTVSDIELAQLVQHSGLGVRVTSCRWSSAIRLQHRLASSFRQGSVFLAGDAAHVHSPAAAQGMNTGLLDAVNLGWKLAFSTRNGPAEQLLASYGDERRPVARQVVALTRLVFFAEASTSPLARLVRSVGAPLAAPAIPRLLGQRWLTAAAFGLLSQRWVSYRNSALSVVDGPIPGGPRPGDQLSDRDVTAAGRADRLHAVIGHPGVHLLLDRDAAAPEPELLGPWVTPHRLDSPGHGLMTVRPDGHIGYQAGELNLGGLGAWLDLVGARPQTQARMGR